MIWLKILKKIVIIFLFFGHHRLCIILNGESRTDSFVGPAMVASRGLTFRSSGFDSPRLHTGVYTIDFYKINSYNKYNVKLRFDC